MDDADETFLREAIALSRHSLTDMAVGPFGAVVVVDGKVAGEGWNQVVRDHDPTAHAEIVALRRAAAHLGTHVLEGAVLYSSCEPCPMCLAAAHWARIGRIVWANSSADAAAIGFDDARLYEELRLPVSARAMPSRQMLGDEARTVFQDWFARPERVPY
jgi:tRNA(Arg) A34 adenosine deaminase TadA